MTRGGLLVIALACALLASGCGASPETIGPSGVDGLEIPTPTADPDDFVDQIDNRYLPLIPGTEWVYRSSTGEETLTVTVTDETRVVQGVTTTVVHDVVRDADGAVTEDTYDWFAQDTAGNVWYFGEDTTEYDDRGRPHREGSWEAGVDGAQAGLVMPAVPRVGDGYEQEHYEGEAEDRARVLSVASHVQIGLGSYDDVVQTEDTTPLEPDVIERKYYAPGVGLVLEEDVGGSETLELVKLTRPQGAS